MDVMLTNGNWAFQRVLCGKVGAKLGQRISSGSREGNMCNNALHVIGMYGPGDKISLFSEDWELAKVALSCHIALDMLCQEMHEAR